MFKKKPNTLKDQFFNKNTKFEWGQGGSRHSGATSAWHRVVHASGTAPGRWWPLCCRCDMAYGLGDLHGKGETHWHALPWVPPWGPATWSQLWASTN